MTRIMIVGEAFDSASEESGKPFAGAAGHLLFGALRRNGIDPAECIITCAFNERPPAGDTDNLFTNSQPDAAPNTPLFAPRTWLHSRYAHHLAALNTLRLDVKPNVILALGDIALWALTYQRGIRAARGAPTVSFDGKTKIIPSYAPAAVVRQFDLYPIFLSDIRKTLAQSVFPELRRPSRIIHHTPSLLDIERFYHKHIAPAPYISADIETAAGQITEVGFAPSASRALVIPFFSRSAPKGNYWPTLEQELTAWSWVRRVLAEKPLIGQNFQYDMSYLYGIMGLPCPGFIGDTMLLAHSMEPEMEKSLGFLGSIHTSEPQWKFMRRESNKREDS